jgi:chromate transporter
VVLAAWGVNELAVLFGAGACAVIAARGWDGKGPGTAASGLQQLMPFIPAAVGGMVRAVSLPSLFWVFFKIGSVLFGGGYVLLAFLRADLVIRLGWLTESQLLDAIAIGQVTPGPVFTTATFIGYILAGSSGALVATAGIFLPAFVFVALSAPLIPRLRASAATAAFLSGVNVAAVALMLVVVAQLARAALVDAPTVALCIASAALLWRFKLNSTWLVLGGAAAGWSVHVLGLAAR